MSGDETAFFDTNILLYLFSGDKRKADKAETLMGKGSVISVQVLNEFTSVASRKMRMTLAEVRDITTTFRASCRTEPLTSETYDIALEISDRFGFTIYDASIVAAAQLAQCSILYSEDMQHGQKIGGLVIRNPFK